MLKTRVRSSEQPDWGYEPRTVALAARKQGRIHVGVFVTQQGEFIVDGNSFLNQDPCDNGKDGCVVASEVRIVRRALAVMRSAVSLNFQSGNEKTVSLFQRWLAGTSTTPPDWYNEVNEENSFMTVIRGLDPGRHSVTHVPLDGENVELVLTAEHLADMTLAALTSPDKDRNWVVDQATRLTQHLVPTL